MTRSRYNAVEALNRILRTLQGKALTVDTPEVVTGDVLNYENALSDLSELLDNSLPGETLTLPAAVTAAIPAATSSVAGIAQLADVTEANAGTSQDTILTPEAHTWAHEYTEVYSNTGSSIQSFGAGAWTQITGAYINKVVDSGEFGYDGGAITVNEVGTYFVEYNISLFPFGTATRARIRAYNNNTSVPATETLHTIAASGTITNVHGFGITYVGTAGHKLDLRMKFDDANDVQLETLQFSAIKQIGGL